MNILLVDDEAKVARFVTRCLRAEGHTVHTVGRAEEAEAALAMSVFDLIILDLQLPGVDGVTFCRQQRARGNDTPILMLTARDTVEDRVLGLESGADDYLVKPFALKELIARVGALPRRGSQGRAHELRAADLTVDTRSRRVSRGGREISLSTKEYRLLTYLMTHSDQVVSRPVLEEAVWGFDFDCATNVVDVYIGLLRRKLEAGDRPRLIHTVRGAGYVLRPEAGGGSAG